MNECCICYTPQLLYRLECKHTVCYPCLKQWQTQGNLRCPYCRQTVADVTQEAKVDTLDTSECKWVYSGRHWGWWYYTPSVSAQLERAYQDFLLDLSPSTLEIQIMGQTYTIDFERMVQTSGRRLRSIRRQVEEGDLVKGLAGLSLHPAEGDRT